MAIGDYLLAIGDSAAITPVQKVDDSGCCA